MQKDAVETLQWSAEQIVLENHVLAFWYLYIFPNNLSEQSQL